MTNIQDLLTRRKSEQRRIRMLLDARKSEDQAKLKGGEDAVAALGDLFHVVIRRGEVVCLADVLELVVRLVVAVGGAVVIRW